MCSSQESELKSFLTKHNCAYTKTGDSDSSVITKETLSGSTHPYRKKQSTEEPGEPALLFDFKRVNIPDSTWQSVPCTPFRPAIRDGIPEPRELHWVLAEISL